MTLRYAIVGDGRMGRAVDAAATARGHRHGDTLDAEAMRSASLEARLEPIDVAFEFTQPEAAAENVERLIRSGCPVVCGTTAWVEPERLDALCRERGVAAVIAPNFSLGMQLFYRLAEQAATLFARVEGYEPFLHEMHHRGKRDLPSGTARRLAERIAARTGCEVVLGDPEAPLAEGALHVSATRGGGEPGSHTVGFDGAHDLVTMTHRARGRGVFATGAVVAAEWLQGRVGRYDFDAVVGTLLEPCDGENG